MGEITVGYRIPSGAVAGIYHAYPKHVKPLRAKKAITLALREIAKRLLELQVTPHEWLLQRVEHYARYRRNADPRFTPHCATWMNDGRYDDDPREWGRDSVRPQLSTAEQEFRAMEKRWCDISLAKQEALAARVRVLEPGYIPQGETRSVPSCLRSATKEEVSESPRLLHQALSIWDKHKGTSSE